MKILVAPDSFKGSLSAKNICEITERVVTEIFEEIEVLKIPMADGGEGTVEAVLDALSGEKVEITVKNPLGNPHKATYGIFNQTNAIMEMAEASGITLVSDSERNILKQNTYGTGEMILDAINRGVNTIYIGIGGSATNDGGIGFASAIGAEFLNKNAEKIEPIPENFEKICDVNTENIDKRILSTKIVIMSDVTNPLLGEKGATYVFGRQKGANDSNIDILERGMAHLAEIYKQKLGKDVGNIAGSGAAGGLGAGLLTFTNATMNSGVSTIMDIVSLENAVKNVDLVITGEGMMDYQSAYGKVCSGVGSLCKKYDVPCIAIVGAMGENAEAMYDYGITSIMTTVNKIQSLDEAILNAEELFKSAVRRALRIANAFKK